MALNRGAIAAALAVLGAIFVSCGIDMPDYTEGRNTLYIQVIDTSGSSGETSVLAAGATIEMSSSSQISNLVFTADDSGRVAIENLVSGEYYIQASKRAEVQYGLLVGQTEMRIENESEIADTIFLSFVRLSPVVINEVYFCGCNASLFYMYDQFVELYNSTADTIYLDGYFMCRSTQVDDVIGVDYEAVDYALGYYVYAFPGVRGVTRECPIAPNGYLVLAQDAINHHQYGAFCVDLSRADWEFFNPLSSDYDNLLVPNLTPVSRQGVDFTYNLAHCALWLATGEEYEFQEHSYYSGTTLMTTEYVHIPLRTIVDGIEYSSNPDSPRYMTLRIDAGYAGVGIVKYTGFSTERRLPGFDTNNGAFDFVTTTPTPGYSHEQ